MRGTLDNVFNLDVPLYLFIKYCFCPFYPFRPDLPTLSFIIVRNVVSSQQKYQE
jgi:hypothetical protein